ncbi:hypothetical protein ACNKHM_06950 [Shigella sonnei]
MPILFMGRGQHLIRYQCAGLNMFTHRNWRDASLTVPFPAGGYHYHAG